MGTDWQRITVPFSGLFREPGNIPIPSAFSPAGVVSLRFAKAAAVESYDLWLDDVAFLP